ncbi:MAG TPA: cytochrome P450 [Sporichthya sp.]|nr:cytochrome P450 [Sporichthya sp.]
MAVKSAVRWGVRHGLAQVAIKKGAKRGDNHARLVTGGSDIDPHPIYDEMRAKGPVVMGAFAMVTARHGVISEILKSDDFGAGLPLEALPRPLAAVGLWAQNPRNPGPVEPPSLLVINGVDHMRLRKLVSRAFTARAVEAIGHDIETVATQLLDKLAREHPGGGHADLVTEYAHSLPVQIIAKILGVPISMQDTFLRWGDDLAASLDIGLPYRQFRQSEKALAALNAWLREHCDNLRRNPGDDLLSRVVLAGRDDGTELNDQEMTSLAGLVLAAGFETTVNLIGNGAVLLFEHPEQRELLRADPGLWRNAVEEVLRFDSPVQNTARHAVRDTTVEGVAIRKQVLVALMLAGANRDPAVFANPHTFDVTRANAKEHLSFSAGPHYCLGAALARMEGEIGLRMLFDRFPDLTAAGPAQRRKTRILHGWAAVPVELGMSVPAPA